MNSRTPQNLLKILDKHFDSAALRELAYEMGTDYENLIGENRRGRFLSLIQFAEQRNRTDELLALVVERRPFLRQELGLVQMKKISVETIKWVALILGLIAALITISQIWPSKSPPEIPIDRILLQVQVSNSENQSAIVNAKVTVDLPGELISPERTDANGRAVFSLKPETDGSLARVTVETSEVKTQNISINLGMSVVEFQIRP